MPPGLNFVLCVLLFTVSIAETRLGARLLHSVEVDCTTTDTAVHWRASVSTKEAVRRASSRGVLFFDVTSWYGRTGNNVVQVRKALRYALCCQGVLQLPHQAELPQLSRFLDFSQILIDPAYDVANNCGSEGFSGAEEFFFPSKAGWPAPKCQYDEYSALQFFIFGNNRPHGCEFPGSHCASELEDALVVQIRSGDVFHNGFHGARGYTQPPLGFYEYIIYSRSWPKIIFVSSVESADINPIWTYFLDRKNWPQNTTLVFQMSTTLHEDMRTLWCARYFVTAQSTLSSMIFETAPYLKEYWTLGGCGSLEKSVRCHHLQVPGYAMGKERNWTNSAEQREEMLAYESSQVLEN